MKALVELRQKSNDQLKGRLTEIKIALQRIKGYNHGLCKQLEHPIHQHRLRQEQARILTILQERISNKEVKLQ